MIGPTASPGTGAAALALAVHAYRRGEPWAFAAHGVTQAQVDRALYLATASAQAQADDEHAVERILAACRAPGCSVQTVEVVTRIADETPAERVARWRDCGFFDAVTGHSTPIPSAGAEAYAAGRTDFLMLEHG